MAAASTPAATAATMRAEEAPPTRAGTTGTPRPATSTADISKRQPPRRTPARRCPTLLVPGSRLPEMPQRPSRVHLSPPEPALLAPEGRSEVLHELAAGKPLA